MSQSALSFMSLYDIHLSAYEVTNAAYLKGFSEQRRVVFFFLAYLFSFWKYSCFCIMQMRKVMTS